MTDKVTLEVDANTAYNIVESMRMAADVHENDGLEATARDFRRRKSRVRDQLKTAGLVD